jgi:hypothetical protein
MPHQKCGRQRESGHDVVWLRSASMLGYRWTLSATLLCTALTSRYRGYENAELVSSKQLTCFSDFR